MYCIQIYYIYYICIYYICIHYSLHYIHDFLICENMVILWKEFYFLNLPIWCIHHLLTVSFPASDLDKWSPWREDIQMPQSHKRHKNDSLCRQNCPWKRNDKHFYLKDEVKFITGVIYIFTHRRTDAFLKYN